MAALGYLFLALFGIGPTMLMRRSRSGVVTSWLLAPTVGFALLLVCCTLMVDLRTVIGDWAPWSIEFALVLSVLCWVLYKTVKVRFTAAPERKAAPSWEWLWALAAVVMGLGLALTPVLMGGRWFHHFRGDAGAAYDAVTAAGALMHDPLNTFSSADDAALLAQNPNYPKARQLLQSAWSENAGLGWAAASARWPLFDMQPHYGVLHLLLAIGPAFVLAMRLGAGPRWSFIAAVAAAMGFWGQFLFDSVSLPQLNALPMIMLLLAAWPDVLKGDGWNPFGAGRPMLMAGFAGLTLGAPQMVVPVLAGAIVGGMLRVIVDRRPRGLVGVQVIPIAVGIAAGVLLAPATLAGVRTQFAWAIGAAESPAWINLKHAWLAGSPLRGAWGLTHQAAGLGGAFNNYLNIGMSALAVGAALLLAWRLAMAIGARGLQTGDRMLAGMLLVGIIIAAGLLAVGRRWLAAEALSTFAPLALLAAIGWGAGFLQRFWRHDKDKPIDDDAPRDLRRQLTGGAVCAVVALLAMSQWWSAALRVVLVYKGSDYQNYIQYSPLYRATDFDVSRIASLLGRDTQAKLAVMTGNPWLARLLRLELGWNVHLAEPRGITDAATGQVTPGTPVSGKINYWAFDRSTLPWYAPESEMLLRTADLTLTKDFPFILDVANPNGLDREPITGKAIWWVGRQGIVLRVNSPRAGRMALSARFVPGPSLQGSLARMVEVTSDADPSPGLYNVTRSTRAVMIPVKQGISFVRLACKDEPNVAALANGDRRELLLGIIEPQMTLEELSPASSPD